jgi:hypothetical protein
MTTPTTRSATTAAAANDTTGPRGALKQFTLALDAGDRAKILELLQANTDAEKKLAAACADLAEATATLRRAAIKSFGADRSRPLGVDSTATNEALKRINAAEEKIEGDRATIRERGIEGPPLTLVKQNHAWRVPVSEWLMKDVEPAAVDGGISDTMSQAKFFRELAAEIEAGKYKTAVEARQAYDKRVMQLTMPPANANPDAATKAATKP